MKKNKLIIIGVALLLSCSSCGIFKKGCGCPTFGKVKSVRFRCEDMQISNVQINHVEGFAVSDVEMLG